MPKRRRKLYYYVQDWRVRDSLWWIGGRWTALASRDPASRCVSMRRCLNKKQALRHARRIRQLGGMPLISCRIVVGLTSWTDYFLGSDQTSLKKAF